MDRYKFYKNGGRYMNFAKKYLTNSIKSNMVSHAYMFEGPNGIGKNTMARELAAILLEMENLFNSPDYIEIKNIQRPESNLPD